MNQDQITKAESENGSKRRPDKLNRVYDILEKEQEKFKSQKIIYKTVYGMIEAKMTIANYYAVIQDRRILLYNSKQG